MAVDIISWPVSYERYVAGLGFELAKPHTHTFSCVVGLLRNYTQIYFIFILLWTQFLLLLNASDIIADFYKKKLDVLFCVFLFPSHFCYNLFNFTHGFVFKCKVFSYFRQFKWNFV